MSARTSAACVSHSTCLVDTELDGTHGVREHRETQRECKVSVLRLWSRNSLSVQKEFTDALRSMSVALVQCQ